VPAQQHDGEDGQRDRGGDQGLLTAAAAAVSSPAPTSSGSAQHAAQASIASVADMAARRGVRDRSEAEECSLAVRLSRTAVGRSDRCPRTAELIGSAGFTCWWPRADLR
jgi:hypothetical protein